MSSWRIMHRVFSAKEIGYAMFPASQDMGMVKKPSRLVELSRR